MIRDILDGVKILSDPSFPHGYNFLMHNSLFPRRSFQVGNVAGFLKQIKRGNLEKVRDMITAEPLLVF